MKDYFDTIKDGTLLHRAAWNRMNVFAEVLINEDGFDCFRKSSTDYTPYGMSGYNLPLLAMMQV